MRVMKDRDRTPSRGCSLSCFGEIVSRDPFYLVAKSGSSARGLPALLGARVAVVSEVPTPWLCLQADLRDAGIALSTVNSSDVVIGLSMQQQVEALKHGEVDVVQLFEPYVSEVLANGAGRIIYSGCQRGPTVYTTFICSMDGLAHHRESFRRLVLALGKVQHWIVTHGADELTELVAPFFRGISNTLLTRAIRRYHDAEVWARQTEISPDGFERLARCLHTAGFIGTLPSYESCVAQISK